MSIAAFHVPMLHDRADRMESASDIIVNAIRLARPIGNDQRRASLQADPPELAESGPTKFQQNAWPGCGQWRAHGRARRLGLGSPLTTTLCSKPGHLEEFNSIKEEEEEEIPERASSCLAMNCSASPRAMDAR